MDTLLDCNIGKDKCLDLDYTLAVIACVLRSALDAFYAIHILFQFHTAIIRPTPQGFGRTELIEDRMAIAKRYLSTYFIVDILSILPLPQETRGVEEEELIRNLPKDLRRDIKRHLCLDLLMKVPMFKKMDQQLWDPLIDRLKPVLYTDKSYIVREGNPVDEMLFIMRGNLATKTTNGAKTDLKAGDFCGEELLTWVLDPHTSTKFPTSTRTVEAKTQVEAFVLIAEDLKTVASQFQKLHSQEFQHTFRFYSLQWKTWAACFIQAAWRRFRKRMRRHCATQKTDCKMLSQMKLAARLVLVQPFTHQHSLPIYFEPWKRKGLQQATPEHDKECYSCCHGNLLTLISLLNIIKSSIYGVSS